MFDKVKRGEIEEVRRLIQESNVDVKAVIDEPKNFSQSLLFSACVVPDHASAFKMIKMLVEMGVEAVKEDSLK